MNSSRLFVALCGAVHIPARTVWEVVNAHEEIGGYNNHHQWAEMMDESGFWLMSDNRPDSMVISYSYEYLPY